MKRRIPELIKEGNTFEELLAAAKGYGDFCRATNEEYVRMARTFYGPDEWWLEDYELPERKPVKVTEPTAEEKRRSDAQSVADMEKYRSRG